MYFAVETKRTAAMTTWLNGVKKAFSKQISYQAGYAPASTAATTVPSIPPATTG